MTTIDALVSPLSPAELSTLHWLMCHASPDLDLRDLTDAAAAFINHCHAGGPAGRLRSGTQIRSIIDIAKFLKTGLFDVPTSVDTLAGRKLQHAARPTIEACLKCGRTSLKLEKATHTPFFYSATGPPQQGIAYNKARAAAAAAATCTAASLPLAPRSCCVQAL